MFKKSSLVVLLMLLLCSFVSSQEEEPRPIAEIMQDIKNQVTELEALSEARLQVIENDKTNIEKLETENNNIKESLNGLLIELSNANETIIRQSERIKIQRSILFTLTIILGAFFILHIVVLILNYKFKITLPYWLNALI